MAVSKIMHDKLNQQIQKEFYSSYFYMQMEAYFASVHLDGFANFFRVQALEERDHAVKFFNFVNETSGNVKLMQIDAPKSDFNSPTEVFKLALEHEQFVTKSIFELVSAAIEEKDFSTQSFLQWFVTEQVEEEANMDKILGKLKYVEGDGRGLLLLDSELGQRVYVPLLQQGTKPAGANA